MFGLSSMTAPLQRVAMRRPDSMLTADTDAWHYGPTYDSAKIAQEHAAFADLVARSGAEVLWMNGSDNGIADSVFTYDASLMTPKGAILMSPGKELRKGEQELHRRFYEEQGIDIVGEIRLPGTVEGGDTLWLDDGSLAVGRGFRSNQDGIEQLTAILGEQGVTVHAFDMPIFHGEAACLHLMSFISPVDHKKAVIHAPLMPVAFYLLLKDLGYELIEASAEDFVESNGLSLNILATAPGKCIMIDGYPATVEAMEKSGVEVQVFSGDALCVACEGGPTCMTRPILR